MYSFTREGAEIIVAVSAAVEGARLNTEAVRGSVFGGACWEFCVPTAFALSELVRRMMTLSPMDHLTLVSLHMNPVFEA